MMKLLSLMFVIITFSTQASPCEDTLYLMKIASKKFIEVRGSKKDTRWEIEGNTQRNYNTTYNLDGTDECEIEIDSNFATYMCKWTILDNENIEIPYQNIMEELSGCLQSRSLNVVSKERGYEEKKSIIIYTRIYKRFKMDDNTDVSIHASDLFHKRTKNRRKYIKFEVKYWR